MNHAADVSAVRDHLRAIYGYDNGGDAPGWLSVFATRGPDEQREKLCRAFQGDDLFGALSRYIALLARHRWNAYVGVGLRHSDPGPGRRGTNRDVMALPALWMDIDIAGPTHTQTDLPPTVDAALDFVRSLPLEPTFVVHSGGGLQPWWGFNAIQVIESDDDRELATLLARRFQEFVARRGEERGRSLDHTHDLARVLRVAGTLNWKTDPPQPVRILSQSNARYEAEELQPMLETPPEPSAMPSTSVQRWQGRGEGTADTETRIRACLESVGGWDVGNRDNACFNMATFLRNQLELSPFEALDWLRRLNSECSKPLADAVLTEKVRRVWAS